MTVILEDYASSWTQPSELKPDLGDEVAQAISGLSDLGYATLYGQKRTATAPNRDRRLAQPAWIKSMLAHLCVRPYSQPVRRLAKMAGIFCDSPYLRQAYEAGWRLEDVFGGHGSLDPEEPAGLVYFTALWRLPMKLQGIDTEGAKIAVLDPATGRRMGVYVWRPNPWRPPSLLWETPNLPVLHD